MKLCSFGSSVVFLFIISRRSWANSSFDFSCLSFLGFYRLWTFPFLIWKASARLTGRSKSLFTGKSKLTGGLISNGSFISFSGYFLFEDKGGFGWIAFGWIFYFRLTANYLAFLFGFCSSVPSLSILLNISSLLISWIMSFSLLLSSSMQVTLVSFPWCIIYLSRDIVFIVFSGVFLHNVSARLCFPVEFNFTLWFLRPFYNFLRCISWLKSLSSSGSRRL